MGEGYRREKPSAKIDDWLLATLRFAITLEQDDRVAVMTKAQELDWPSGGRQRKAFAFFTRTSVELCDAIADKTSPRRGVVICRQLARIENPRLRSAFEAASDLEAGIFRALSPKRRWHGDLWKGLPA
jgi:hypothetical protein